MTRPNHRNFFETAASAAVICSIICIVACIKGATITSPYPKKDDLIARAGASEKKDSEKLLGAESGFGCPNGFKFNTLYRFCTDGKQVQGPFPPQMISNCKADPSTNISCTSLLWPVDFTKRIRGTEQCPPGTGLDEILGVCAVGDFVFGPFPLDLIQLCDTNTTNSETCKSMQWDRKTIAAVVVNNRPPAALGSPSNPFLIEAPAASDKGKRLNLWATQYYLETAEDVSDGLPLRALDGAAIGPVLERKKWCSAAMEGSVRVVSGKSAGKTFNYAGKTDEYRVNCSAYYDHPASGGVKFRVARGAHGDGVLSYILVPYRTIAVDSDYISYGSIIYIPQARGISIKQSNGSMLQHDGYFFAGDAGGLIKDNHIDVFTGDNKSNPFDFLKSDDSKTFEAWVITNPNISVKMRVLHTKK